MVPLLDTISDLLACPMCKATLELRASCLVCTGCRAEYPQQDEHVDLLPSGLTESRWAGWSARQQECDDWYSQLLTDTRAAANCFVNDYEPYAAFLASLRGDVLDIGGGNGVVRHYLPNVTRYVTLEPSAAWLAEDWAALADRFPCVATRPAFVKGVGEYMPFADSTFDGVLSCWSMNHVVDPAAVFGEMGRVLRPGGRALVILEDMVPRWRDLVSRDLVRRHGGRARRWLALKVVSTVARRPWPLQADHIPIAERDMHRWLGEHFTVVRREWVTQYLTYELRRV